MTTILPAGVKATTGGRFDRDEHLLYFLATNPDLLLRTNYPQVLVAVNELNSKKRLDQFDRLDRPDAGIVLPAPKKTIASLLNLTPETFSRVLRNLVEDEILSVSGRRIRIRNRAQLARLLESSPVADAGGVMA